MKKRITAILMASMFAVMMPITATTAMAQTRSCNSNNRSYSSREGRGSYNDTRRSYNERGYSNDTSYNDPYYNNGSNDPYYNNGQPNVYDRHRKAINIGVATGAGAIIGALIGGKRGALIGAGAGVAAGAIVTAKQRPRNYIRY